MPLPEIKTVSFAGSGNVASNLAPALKRAGLVIRNVCSRNLHHASALAAIVNALPVESLEDLRMDTDLLILALPDKAIPDIAIDLRRSGRFKGIVAHTSGSLSLDVISRQGLQGGVFYPLQSFTKHSSPDIAKVPFCIEGTSSEIEIALAAVARKLSSDVRFLDSLQRASIHLAAVFANNFTNYMYAVADCLLENCDVNPDILLPLIQETALRLKGGDAAQLQTGPAVRADWPTIDQHLELLKQNPELAEVYKLISSHIVKLKNSGKAC